MDDDFRVLYEITELFNDLSKFRFIAEEVGAQTVHSQRARIGIALGIDVIVKIITGEPTIEHLDTTNLNDAIAAFGIEAGGFSIKNDLSHCVMARDLK